MSKFKVDFSGVGDGPSSLIPEGNYVCVVSKIERTKSKSNKPMLKITFKIGTGEYKGKTIVDNIVLIPNVLWKLRNFIQSLGIEVPKSSFVVDITEYKGKVCGVEIFHEENEYRGKTRTRSVVGETYQVQKNEDGKYIKVEENEANDLIESNDEDEPIDLDKSEEDDIEI